VRALTEVWTGDRTPDDAMRSRDLQVLSARADAARLWQWLGASAFAPTRREVRGSASAP
jgi:hypothetical protein